MALFCEIQFLSKGFPFLATSPFYRVSCRLFNTSIELFFFPFLFFVYFHSIDPRVVSIVSGGSN